MAVEIYAPFMAQYEFFENMGICVWSDYSAVPGYFERIYWMPLEWGQTDPKLTTSLMYEDKLLLTIRIERLKGKRTYSQKSKSRCHHVLQTPQIEKRDEANNGFVTWGIRCITWKPGTTSSSFTPPGRPTHWPSLMAS